MIDNYIKSLEELKNHKISQSDDLYILKNKTISIIRRIYGSESSHENHLDFIVYRKYPNWHFGGGQKISGDDNLESCKNKILGLIDGVIEELRNLGLPTKEIIESSDKLSLTVNQTQSQIQTINVEILLKTLKEELTEKEYEELNEIIQKEENADTRKMKIFEKIKSFGKDTLSNIIANLLTNPSIYL